MDVIRKMSMGEIVDVSPGQREVVAVISTPDIDRDGEVVLSDGLARKQYAGLSVLLNHDQAIPIGKSLWVKSAGGRVLAKHRFSDATPLARDCFALAQDGVLNQYSVGFVPTDSGPPTAMERKSYGDAVKIYRAWELMEYSLVSVPSNPNAVALAVSKGLIGEESARIFKSSDPVYTLNQAGYQYAMDLINAGKLDDGEWDPKISSPGKDGDWVEFGHRFLAVDAAAPEHTLAHWHFPVVADDKVFLHGLRAAISRASQNGYPEIEAAAQRLLERAEKKIAKNMPLLVARRLLSRL